MESKLAANDHKAGWKGMTVEQVRTRLHEEVEELIHALTSREGGVLQEAADVANFAMFLADLSGELRYEAKGDRGA
jgi:NTP pyrophosphatase (non-canonical NTP hydrolase)